MPGLNNRCLRRLQRRGHIWRRTLDQTTDVHSIHAGIRALIDHFYAVTRAEQGQCDL